MRNWYEVKKIKKMGNTDILDSKIKKIRIELPPQKQAAKVRESIKQIKIQ